MSRNIVNWLEINAFLNFYKEKYPHPLLQVFIESKVKRLLLQDHYYEQVEFQNLTDKEKELVKQKEGTYHRVIFVKDLAAYVIRHCDAVAIEVIRESYKTPQDITNSPNIPPMRRDLFEDLVNPLWSKGDLRIKQLRTITDLIHEGREMHNCLGTKDHDLDKNFYFSVLKGEESFISFKVSKITMDIEEARYKFNKKISREHKDLIASFVSSHFKIPEDNFKFIRFIRLVNIVMFSWTATFAILGSVGLIGYIFQNLVFSAEVLSFFKENKDFLSWSFGLGILAMVVCAINDPRIPVKFKIKKTNVLGRILEAVNEL